MQSFEDSLSRLGLDTIDILYIHDPDNHPDHFEEAKKGALKALVKLRDEGVVRAIGCGMNQNEMSNCNRFYILFQTQVLFLLQPGKITLIFSELIEVHIRKTNNTSY